MKCSATTKTGNPCGNPAAAGLPVCHLHQPPAKRRVAIVGFADSRDEAPFGDPTVELWGMNRLHAVMPDKPWDRYFQLHDILEAHEGDEEHLSWLRAQTIPVYLRPDDIGKHQIPAEIPYPKQEIVEQFGSYFTNTVSWLIAFAIREGFEEIGIYGVDMAQDALLDSEYAYQRPSCEYFIGIAAGLGISVFIPPGSDLLRASHLYGFESGDTIRQKYEARMRELAKRKAAMQQELTGLDQHRGQLIAGINQLEGAHQDVQYWRRNWSLMPPILQEKPNAD